jgi:hypothetical protein
MGKLYKLTRGSVSVIRTDKASVEEAQKSGFSLVGEVREVNNGYEIVTTAVSFDDLSTEKRPRAPRHVGESESGGNE